jgi:hypothetical protein
MRKMPCDGSLGAASYSFGSNQRNQVASHSNCANIKKAHSLERCELLLWLMFDVRPYYLAENDAAEAAWERGTNPGKLGNYPDK